MKRKPKVLLTANYGPKYLSRKTSRNSRRLRPPVVSDPPPRWTYYHTSDDGVWVRKGPKAVKPVPYEDPRPAAFPRPAVTPGMRCQAADRTYRPKSSTARVMLATGSTPKGQRSVQTAHSVQSEAVADSAS